MNIDNTIIDTMDIEREIEKNIITALRFLFSANKRFRYDEKDSKTRVCLTTDYVETEAPLKLPHIVLSGITYSFDMGTSFFNNYSSPIFKDGVNVGHKYINIIPFSYQLSCYGENYVSRDLANAVLNYVTFAGIPAFRALNIRTLRADKGNTTPTSQFPKVFHTAVSVSGSFEWQGEVTAIDETKLNILKSINLKIKK